ncbi:GntR family transcriptional regulator [Tessaracoccus flavescens]|uniref:HTH gntR-type domain-containing protein n=1 Tax=Tessaracoccus flavescens TaxID=399497 RepID=A0A1Q2CZM8_9ACTN|nr:hypothetical protein BW733_13010 [Tessaracoccus flavescens]
MLLGVTSQTGPNLGATPRSLAERARDHIRERITSGQYPPGSRIKERELSEELGISRMLPTWGRCRGRSGPGGRP